MNKVQVGSILHGYCNGFFGRDAYDESRVEAMGVDWIVVRKENGNPNFACFATQDEMDRCLEAWSKNDKSEL